jgi:hypothetical protein
MNKLMKTFILSIGFLLISLNGISQIKGVDYKTAIINKQAIQARIDLNIKVFYAKNDSTYIISYPTTEKGFAECIEKASELCKLNGKLFSDPDSDDGFMPKGFEPENLSQIFVNIFLGRVVINKGWDIGKNNLIFLANDTSVSIEISNRK